MPKWVIQMRFVKIAAWVSGGFIVFLAVLTLLPVRGAPPEVLNVNILGCRQQDTAVAAARTVASGGSPVNTADVRSWWEQLGCGLVPAGTYLRPLQEEAGHIGVTKAKVNGDVKYLLGLPRPKSEEKRHAAVVQSSSSI